MRYTIAIKKEKGADPAYSASVLELPDCKANGHTIEESVNKIRKVIEDYIKCVDDATAVFSPGDSEDADYYYTLDDKRDTRKYYIQRIIWLIFGGIFIYAISCFILGVSPYPLIIDIADEVKKPRAALPSILEVFATIGTILTTIWAIQSYWRLRYIDKQAEKWRPHIDKKLPYKAIDKWSDPFTFHVLAESHKQWAELWFCWCVAIFLGGVTYAIYNIHAHSLTDNTCITCDWPHVVYTIISTQAPSGFIYLLFGVAWYWASKHYRSHWHNFVVNAYRHRALYRFDELRKDVKTLMSEDDFLSKNQAEETILELFRLSGVLLLIQGDSSYLDKAGSEEISKAILQVEEVAKAFTGSSTRMGKD